MADEADDEEEGEEEENAVELGDRQAVEGVPVAQVASRLHWGIAKSDLRRREGETVIRTPDGPRELGDVLDQVDETYFDRRQSFTEHVRSVVGTGPVPTSESE